ncbi:MAG: hypothetical protein MI924_20815 [Chloroflexales bacterium]|nr:hypothetical protein [Chloroflexales bacterium]
MRRIVLLLVMTLTLGASLGTRPVTAQSTNVNGTCVEGIQPSGALWLICMPQNWNGDLVIWAHGYVAFNQPLDFQNLELPDGTYLPDLIQDLGFAFATTSYRTNGLAVLEGVDDIRELREIFVTQHGTPKDTYLTGASEGGLVTTLLIEQSPELFSGGLATCGPIGDFRAQINYWGDFFVLFNYFFPGVFPGSPVSIPQEVIDNWESVYLPAASAALAADPDAVRQLIATSKAPIDPNNPETIKGTILSILWYNVFATNDSVAKLGGNPYSNERRWYFGSDNDVKLNREVQRFSADPVALATIRAYQTSGSPTIPLVTLHTVADEIVLFTQGLRYAAKLSPQARQNVIQIPIVRYGHCQFTTEEIQIAFGLLIWKVTGTIPTDLISPFDVERLRNADMRIN